MASDIRQPTMDAKRFHDKKAKWAYGDRCARHYLSSRPRPAMPDTHYTRMTRLFKRNNESNLRHLSNDCSFDLTRDARELLADTDPSVKWTFVSRKNAPDVMIGYGDGAENNNSPDDRNDAPLLYEASGQNVLCDAVDKALEKFEVKETEKLVGEYEVVSHEHGVSEAGMGYSAADEDGFEVVEYVPA